LKHIYRRILNSRTYQLSSIPRGSDPAAEANCASYPLRRLEAEVLIDAICQLTSSEEKYSSPIPEPFTFMPEGQRATTLPDGSITSSFLDMFGRPSRDTGLESERNTRPTTDQRLHLLNSTHIQNKIQSIGKLRGLTQRKASADEIATSLYLTMLSRYPTDEELAAVSAYLKRGGSQREAWVDVVWALMNSAEFLYRH
jgi:hypothetical protein